MIPCAIGTHTGGRLITGLADGLRAARASNTHLKAAPSWPGPVGHAFEGSIICGQVTEVLVITARAPNMRSLKGFSALFLMLHGVRLAN